MKVAVFLKQRLKRLVLGPRASGEDMIEYLRGKGMVIGRDTVIHDVRNVFVDPSRPWMIEIGNNVQITRGVTILTHGYDWSVFKGMYGDVLGSAGRVKIGDNVFIGMNTTILKGVTIGDNVVIGANSLINKDVPSNSVVVGNPQRVVGDVGSYLEKRRRAQIEEVSDLYSCWRRNSPEGMQGCVPPKRIFHEFFWLFEDRGGAPGTSVCGRLASLRNFREELRTHGPNGQALRELRGFHCFSGRQPANLLGVADV